MANAGRTPGSYRAASVRICTDLDAPRDLAPLLLDSLPHPTILVGHGGDEDRRIVLAKSSDIVVDQHKIGTVDVFYKEPRPQEYEGPFLREERALLDAIAERLARVVDHMATETALKESITKRERAQVAVQR